MIEKTQKNTYKVISSLTGRILGKWRLKKDALKHQKFINKNQYHVPKK